MFQSLIGTVQSRLAGSRGPKRGAPFQSLIGTVQSTSNPRHFGEGKTVSIPHRYGLKQWYIKKNAAKWKLFQSLIGTVQSRMAIDDDGTHLKFQSLIGTVQRVQDQPMTGPLVRVSIPHRYGSKAPP